MVNFEFGSQVEKDVFCLIPRERQRKILSPHEKFKLRPSDSAYRNIKALNSEGLGLDFLWELIFFSFFQAHDTTKLSFFSFAHYLPVKPWSLETFNDPNEALEQWYCLCNNVLGKHMPFKTRRVKIKHRPEWFSATMAFWYKCPNWTELERLTRSVYLL